MKVYDISMQISENMMVYKDRPHKKPEIKVVSDFATSSVYETEIRLNMHTGTHMDRPLHIIEGGKNMDTFDLTRMLCKAKVLDLSGIENKYITKEDLEKFKIEEGDFLLLKTQNSYREDVAFDFSFVFLEESGARYLRDCKIDGVGIDALGIERSQEGHVTHKALLENDIIILEGLRLAKVEEGSYQLIALPLAIQGVEASLVKAILIEE